MKPIGIALPTLAFLLGASVSAQDITVGGAHISFADGKALWKEVRLGDTPYSSYVVSEKGRLLDTSGADKSAELLAKVKSLNIHEPWGVVGVIGESAQYGGFEAAFDNVAGKMLDLWANEAGLETYGEAVAEVLEFRAGEGEQLEMSVGQWREFAKTASLYAARKKARSLGVNIVWDCEHAKTTEGYYQVRGGIEYAIAKSLAAAPFCDILWMETATANLKEAHEFAEAIHAKFPDKMMAYNLSSSFNWDSTGMSEEEMKRVPEELGKMGFVFNFITYGGHQIDGLAAEEFATALKQDGMLSLARLQRKLRLFKIDPLCQSTAD